MLKNARHAIRNGDEGHVAAGLAGVVGAVGAIVLGIGASTDSDAAALAGGIVLGVGILGYALLDHVTVDYNIFGRLEKLEAKDKGES